MKLESGMSSSEPGTNPYQSAANENPFGDLRGIDQETRESWLSLGGWETFFSYLGFLGSFCGIVFIVFFVIFGVGASRGGTFGVESLFRLVVFLPVVISVYLVPSVLLFKSGVESIGVSSAGRRVSTLREFMNHVDESNDVIDWRMREYTVTKIENVTGALLGFIEHTLDLSLNRTEIGKQNGRVEISLNCAVMPDRSPALIERNAPVKPDHGPRVASVKRCQHGVPCSEVDYRYSRHD
jgi:hypothetical protein